MSEDSANSSPEFLFWVLRAEAYGPWSRHEYNIFLPLIQVDGMSKAVARCPLCVTNLVGRTVASLVWYVKVKSYLTSRNENNGP